MSFRMVSIGFLLVAVAVAVEGCSSGSSSSGSTGSDASDCAATGQEIHDAAVKRGLDPNTVCSSSDPTVVKDFGAACAKQKGC